MTTPNEPKDPVAPEGPALPDAGKLDSPAVAETVVSTTADTAGKVEQVVDPVLAQIEAIEDTTDRDTVRNAELFLRSPGRKTHAAIRPHAEDVSMIIAMSGGGEPAIVTDVSSRLEALLREPETAEATAAPERQRVPTAELLSAMRARTPAGLTSPAAIGEYIAAHEVLCRSFQADLEEAFTQPALELPKCRDLLKQHYSYAKSMLVGVHQKPEIMAEMKAWQQAMLAKHVEVVSLIVYSYMQDIDTEIAKPQPELIMIRQWMMIAAGFDPSLTPDLEQAYGIAVAKYCQFFLDKVAAERLQPNPNTTRIEQWLAIPPKYANAKFTDN
ncbi:MAG TPA: hypothetical protein PKV72_03590 [Candidatus Peribacteria bacterium]|nr:hypothetical protein [Candidatus Peribacteria bacterium]